MTTTIAAIPELFPGIGMLVYVAVLLGIFGVLVFPFVFPVAVTAIYVVDKTRPTRLALTFFAAVQVVATVAMIVLGKFLLWAAQQ